MARRKGKRFTPKLLAKFDKEGRGRGTHQNYAPYHQVTRSDPSSKGTSTIVPGQKGFSDPHLLSEGELVKGYFFAAMLEHLDDLRPQYKLNLNPHAGEAIEYLQPAPEDYFPGTLQLATAMGIRHPIVRLDGVSDWWRMTTDIVTTIRPPNGICRLLALSCKTVAFAALNKREKNLLAIDREYWICQGHDWLLITPEVYDELFALALECSSGWALLSPPVAADYCEEAAHLVKMNLGLTLCQAYALLRSEFQCGLEAAQAIFWQSVWRGFLPIDLRPTLWVSNPLRHISTDAFHDFNPVASRRSAWIA